MNKALLYLLILALTSTLSYARQPSETTIKKWLNQDNFSIIHTQSVYLLDNERAYLVKVRFTATPLKEGLVLVRPELDEARFIPDFAKEFIVTDLDHDGVSEIVYTQKSENDTHTIYKRFLIQLHDYDPFELYSVSYQEEKKCRLCVTEDIQWGFEDLTNNKIKDLKQEYTLHIQGDETKLLFKERTQEIEFNKKGFNLPVRPTHFQLDILELSRDVIDREPISPTQSFALNDERVFCFLDFKDVTHEDTIVYHWIHETLGEVVNVEQNIHPAKRFRTWIYKSLNEDQKYLGNWRVIVTDRYKNILASKEFTVVDNLPGASHPNQDQKENL